MYKIIRNVFANIQNQGKWYYPLAIKKKSLLRYNTMNLL